jgi:hypothetical protein
LREIILPQSYGRKAQSYAEEERVDTLRSKDAEILDSTSPLNLDPLRYLSQRWFSPQALTFRVPLGSWMIPKFVLFNSVSFSPHVSEASRRENFTYSWEGTKTME